ncbi:MAG: putative monovalent cation/H+ antiporter subunit A [Cryomorphaceae bacterium]
MLWIVLSGFIVALLLPRIMAVVPRMNNILWIALPAALCTYFATRIPGIISGEVIRESVSWVPSLGVNFSFVLDGLSLLFAVMITGIGTLVFIYTHAYMHGHKELDRFYAYLSFFMASMLGLVLSDNLFLMFVFWELTSISSFFLIGFNNKEEASRKSALTALAVTGIGGMGLLAAAVIVNTVAGTTDLEGLYAFGNLIQDSPLSGLLVALIFLAAFTKSAQFPFHFWLPDAMKAPTPVSTYLHSATMVKAGIFLLLRFSPSLDGMAFWNDGLMIVGGFTMLYSAVLALFKTDMKAILAYTTISALGVLTFLIGLGTEAAMTAALVFIFVHATYKATLFLVTGIVDHETKTRDVTQLGGLRKVLMPVAFASVIAALSSAGLPLSFGFIGKDLIYESTLGIPNLGILLTAAALLTNVFLLHAGFVAGIRPFSGKMPEAYGKVHLPSPAMWVPPLLLAALCIVLGVYPALLEGGFVHPALASLGFAEATPHLKLWHGFNTVLLLSGITLALGAAVFFAVRPSHALERRLDSLSRISPKGIYEAGGRMFNLFSLKWTHLFQNGYLRYYVLMILFVLIALLGSRMSGAINLHIKVDNLLELSWYEIAIAVLLILGVTVTVFTRSRLTAVLGLGVVGYAICLFFVFYSAPDLAMTQFTIDTLTVILFVLVLYRLPRYLKLSDLRSRARDWIFATVFGGMITLIALAAVQEGTNRETSEYYAENAYLLAKGKNIVNVILVDFRGTDTMIEITVLAVAALGVFSLLKLRLKKSDDI